MWATALFLAGNRMTIIAFEREVSLKIGLKSLSLFSKTIVRQYSVVLNLKKNISYL